jgi:hypothetical protein
VLAVLAIVLIAGGALAAAYLVTQDSKTVPAIEISQAVTAGERIPLSAMQQVNVSSGSGVNYVPWDEANQVAQFYAGSAIPAGTLLNGAMVVRAGDLVGKRDVIGLALKEGQLPTGLQIGDHVDLFQVSDSSTSCPGAPGSALDNNATVLAILAPSAESGSSASDYVEVATNPADAGAITCNAANGNVGVAIIPATGASPAAAQPSGGATSPAGGATTGRPAGHKATSPGATHTGSTKAS